MSQRLNYNQVAPAGAKALGGVHGYLMQSSLAPALIELVYLTIAISLMNAYNRMAISFRNTPQAVISKARPAHSC